MGTHPIFESDFVCLTEQIEIGTSNHELEPKEERVGPLW